MGEEKRKERAFYHLEGGRRGKDSDPSSYLGVLDDWGGTFNSGGGRKRGGRPFFILLRRKKGEKKKATWIPMTTPLEVEGLVNRGRRPLKRGGGERKPSLLGRRSLFPAVKKTA